MKVFAQYFRNHNGELIERLGSDGVAHLDARSSLSTLKYTAARIGRNRGNNAFRLYRTSDGRYSTGTPFTDIIHIIPKGE